MPIIMFYFSSIVALIILYFSSPAEMNPVVMEGLACFAALNLLVFYFKKESEANLKGQFIKHSNLVLLGYVIVHFQHYIDFIIGKFTEYNSSIWVNSAIVTKSMTLSIIGLVCFLLGYLLWRNKKNQDQHQSERVYKTDFLKALAAFSLLAYFGTINPLYMAGGYGVVDMGSNATYAAFAFDMLIFAIIIQESRNIAASRGANISFKKYAGEIGYPTLAMMALYLGTVLLSGDRGEMITYALCYLAGYLFITKAKVGLLKGFALVFLAATLISLLGVARSIDSAAGFNQKIYMALQKEANGNEESFLSQTQELAGSIKTLHYAVDFVPEKHDFLFGRFQLQQIINVLPFASVFYPVIFEDISTRYAGSASFITWIVQGDYPTYGNGASVVADFYLAFGLFGVVAGMLVFGGLMRQSEMMMFGPNMPGLFWHVFSVVYFCNSIYIARSSFLEGFKFLVWVYIIILFNRYVFNRRIHA